MLLFLLKDRDILVKISVIVPVYNTENYLKECIDSLKKQTFKDFEVLFIDDGSTDQSLSILKQNQEKNFFIYTKENGGQATARNLGIRKARGEYLTFVDSDDFIAFDMLEILYQKAKEKDADLVISDLKKVQGEKQTVFSNYFEVKKEKNKNYMVSHMGPVARLYKKELFIKNQIFFKEHVIYEDLASLPLLGIYAKKIEVIKKPYYFYRIREGSTMKQKKYHKKLEDIFIVMENLKEEMQKRSKNKYQEELEYLFTEHLLYSAYLRFLSYHKKENLQKIKKIMKENYPHFYKNIYFKNKSKKFQIVCFLAYMRFDFLLRILKKGKKEV